jgi:hypothetical protein
MQETVEQYKQRIMANLGDQDPMRVQSKTVSKIERLVKRVPLARLRKRPAPGKWSVGEILAHLADCEIVTGYRMRSILGAPGTPIAAFDQDKWAESQNKARSQGVVAGVANVARSESGASEIAPPRTVETFRRPRRAR